MDISRCSNRLHGERVMAMHPEKREQHAVPPVPHLWRGVGALMAAQSGLIRWMGSLCKFSSETVSPSGPIIPADVSSILVIRVDEIGDLVMSSVFLRNLRAWRPRSRITLLVKEEVRNLVEHCPYVNDVLAVRNTCNLFARWFLLPWRMMAFGRRHLAGRGISLTIQPRWDVDAHYATVLAYCAGSRWRLGYSEHVELRRSFYNRGFDALLTHVVDDRDAKHEIDRGLSLLRFLGATPDTRGTELWLDSADRTIAARRLTEQGIPADARVAAIAPGAGRARRQWSPESFAAVGKWLVQEHGCAVAVIGGPQDHLRAEQVVNGIRAGAVNLAGKTTLRQTAALLERCVAFVGNDSGPLHLAVAAGVPAVEISCHPRQGSRMDIQSPFRFGPWGQNARVLQPAEPMAPCVDGCQAAAAHCITRITVDEVQQALAELCFNTPPAP